MVMLNQKSIGAEITMELLTDLATAIRNVMKQAVPSLPLDIVVMSKPKMGILIRVKEEGDPIYPHIIKAKAVVKPTAAYRKLLELPAEEESR